MTICLLNADRGAEYNFVHEALRFVVPKHNAKFVSMLDQYMSNWLTIRQILNDEPLSHSDWKY
jgi:predicted metal-dependent hydrolase